MSSAVVKPVDDFVGLRPTSKAISIRYKSACTTRRPTRFETSRPKSCPSQPKSMDTDIDVDNILGPRVKQHVNSLIQAFQALDLLSSGTVAEHYFFNVVDDYCDMPLTSKQMDQLVQKFGTGKNGTISYAKFLANFNNNRLNTSKPLKKCLSDDIENQLRSKLLGEYSSAMKAMQLFDYNNNGFIQKQELKKVLENFCLKMTDSQFEKLWAKYDKENHGSMLNYMDFLGDLGARPARNYEYKSPRMNVAKVMVWGDVKKAPPAKTVVIKPATPVLQNTEHIERDFKTKFRAKYDTIARAVSKLDHRACGFVSWKEFKNIIVSHTVPMSDNLFHSLLERCGITVGHRIHYERFMDYYGEASTNILWQPEAMEGHQDIFTMLRSHINSHFASIKDAFLDFDYNKDGKISRAELRRIVEQFSFRLSEEDYARFMARVDPEHKGYISYHRFLEIFEQKESVKDGHPRLNENVPAKNISPPAVMAWSTVEEILRSKIKDNWQSVSNAFIKMDINKDGFLSRPELRNLLHRFCLPISADHFDMLWTLCDENNDGRISFNEFLRKLGVDIISADLHGPSTKITNESEAREEFMKLDQSVRRNRGPAKISAQQALDVLRNHVMQTSSDMRKIFLKFDSNNDGKISRKEFRQVLTSLGLSLTDEEFNILTTKFGFRNGALSYQDFLKHFQHGKGCAVNHLGMQPRILNTNLDQDVLFTAEEAEARIRTKLQRSFSGLREAFYKFDENHDGNISRGEFRRVLKLFMITLEDHEFERLMERLGVGHGGMLKYREFLNTFENREHSDGHIGSITRRPNLRSARDVGYVSAEEADEIIKRKAREHWQDISKAFRNFDEDGNGVVTKKELKNIVYRYQLALTQQEFDKLWTRYDTDRNGYIDYKEFVAKLGVELSPGDMKGHSTRIIEESYDTIMKPDKKYQIHNLENEARILSPNPQRSTSSAEARIIISSDIQRPTTREVEQKLKHVVIGQFYNFVQAFVNNDSEHTGSVSLSLLHKIIKENGFHISDHHLNQIWNKLPQNQDGTIQYNQFLSLYSNTKDLWGKDSPVSPPEIPATPKVHFRARSAPMTSSLRQRSPVPSQWGIATRKLTIPPGKSGHRKIVIPSEYVKEIEGKIKDKVNDKLRDLQNTFLEHDYQKSGVVTLQQFKDVLFNCNIPLTPDEVRALWRKYDIYHSGSVSYMDFLRSFTEDRMHQASNDKFIYRSKLQPTRISYSPGLKTDQLMTLTSKLRKQIHDNWKSMRRSFRALDQQGNGSCSTLAFRHVLRKYSIELSEEEFYHVCSYYDKDLKGRIPYNEFLGAHID